MYQIYCQPASFNSKVVRLKVLRKALLVNRLEKFQFQSGAVKSGKKRKEERLQRSFNSKVVRLKVEIKQVLSGLKEVSIPKWCG